MRTQELSLDQTFNSLHWTSERAPHLQVQRILFHLPRRNDRDFEWIGRLMRATLKFECSIVDAERHTILGSSVNGELPLGGLVTPLTMQPMFDIEKHWHFQSPRLDNYHHVNKPHWETHLWLDGFELRDGECASLLLTMNAQLLAEIAA
ncbi:MAG: hypothetical protein ABI432_07940 [Flavobacteriales bacterium]